VVADAGEAVLAPAVGAAAGVVVRQVVPGVARGAVVLADGAPLPLAEVRPPAPPRRPAEAVLLEAALLLTRRPAVRGPGWSPELVAPPLPPSMPGDDDGYMTPSPVC